MPSTNATTVNRSRVKSRPGKSKDKTGRKGLKAARILKSAPKVRKTITVKKSGGKKVKARHDKQQFIQV